MIPYEMKKRGPISPKTLKANDGFEIIEYKTGFEEFKVVKVEIRQTDAILSMNLNSFAMAVVVNGDADIETLYGNIKVSK